MSMRRPSNAHVCMTGEQHVQVACGRHTQEEKYSEAQTWLEGLQATAKKCLNVLQRGLRGKVGAEVLTKRSTPIPRARTRDHPLPLWLGSNLGDAVQGPDRVIPWQPHSPPWTAASLSRSKHGDKACGHSSRWLAPVCQYAGTEKGQPMRRTHHK